MKANKKNHLILFLIIYFFLVTIATNEIQYTNLSLSFLTDPFNVVDNVVVLFFSIIMMMILEN